MIKKGFRRIRVIVDVRHSFTISFVWVIVGRGRSRFSGDHRLRPKRRIVTEIRRDRDRETFQNGGRPPEMRSVLQIDVDLR